MKSNSLHYFAISLAFIIHFTSCKKSENLTERTLASTPERIIGAQFERNASLPKDSVPHTATIYNVGKGCGNLIIDGAVLKIKDSGLIKIKAGKYETITIKNILVESNKRVYIKNGGEVMVTGAMYTENLSNVTISGDNIDHIQYGIKFIDIPFRAIAMNGKMDGVTLRNLSFINVKDYVIAGERSNGAEFNYLGTPETRTQNFKILGCSFDNAGQIVFGGNLNKDLGEDTGFFKDVEVAFNVFKNTDAGTVCAFTNVQDFKIHHNYVNNINLTNNNHNGVFYMQGNGDFYDNVLRNYQGNAIRMWPYSRGKIPATNSIYNNICFNTRKYGAFELQAFERNLVPDKTTYANAKIYNNTVGQMNTSHDWEGQILDLYVTGGTLQYYNNLGFDLYSSNGVQPVNMINNMSNTKIIQETNNTYLTDQGEINQLIDFIQSIREPKN